MFNGAGGAGEEVAMRGSRQRDEYRMDENLDYSHLGPWNAGSEDQ